MQHGQPEGHFAKTFKAAVAMQGQPQAKAKPAAAMAKRGGKKMVMPGGAVGAKLNAALKSL